MNNNNNHYLYEPSSKVSLKKAILFFTCSQLLLVSFNQTVLADAGIIGTLTYVDNPRQFEGAQGHDLIRGVAIFGNFARETDKFLTSFNYSLNGQDYRNDLQGDRTFIQGTGQLVWKISPETLSWSLSNTRINAVQDLRLPDNADNQQLIDLTRTGPNLTLPIGASTILNLSLEHAIVSYERSGEFDQKNNVANGSISRQLTDALTLRINASHTQSDFDVSELPSYDNSQLSVATDFDYGNFFLSLELGEQYIDRESLGTTTSPLRAASMSYQLNSRSSVSVNYRDSVQDQFSSLNIFGGFYNFDFVNNVESVDEFGSSNIYGLFKNKSLSTNYSYTVDGSFNFGLGYLQNERAYDTGVRDETSDSIFTSLGVPVSGRVELSFTARFSEYTYSRLDSSEPERQEYRGSANYRISDQTSMYFSLWVIEQESNTELRNFDDINATLSVSYRF